MAAQGPEEKRVDLERISRILGLAYGGTLADRTRGMLFRSVPSAGGLYPCQLYMSFHSNGDIETGLYYCDTVQGFLGRIDPRPLDLAPIFPGRTLSDTCLIISGIFFHSAWKYRERAFRYLLLDAGHLAEALVMAARAKIRRWCMNCCQTSTRQEPGSRSLLKKHRFLRFFPETQVRRNQCRSRNGSRQYLLPVLWPAAGPAAIL